MGSLENSSLLSLRSFVARAATTSNLNYGGGPVQRSLKVYLVFWGFSSDPNSEATYLTRFLTGVGGSQWLSTDNQYYDTTGNISNPSNNLIGTWYDTSTSVPKRPGTSAVASEAARAAAHFGDYSVNAMYFVALPTGHDPSGFKTQWCAFHSDTSTTHGKISYTDFPYSTDAGTSCGENSVNSGSAGVLDGVSIVGGHELAEGQTDPQPSTGWTDSSGAENGDKCAWTNLQNTSFSTGTFATQPIWSNAAHGCVQ